MTKEEAVSEARWQEDSDMQKSKAIMVSIITMKKKTDGEVLPALTSKTVYSLGMCITLGNQKPKNKSSFSGVKNQFEKFEKVLHLQVCPGGEMVDTRDLKSLTSRCAGSIPALGTNS